MISRDMKIWRGGMSNKKAILFIGIAGIVLYYFLIHRRKK